MDCHTTSNILDIENDITDGIIEGIEDHFDGNDNPQLEKTDFSQESPE